MSSEPGGAVAAPNRTFWTGDRVAGILLMAVALVAAAETRALPIGMFTRPGPGYTPLLYGLALFALGLSIAFRRGGAVPAAMRWGELKHALMILGAVSFAAAMIDRLGYRLTMLAVAAFLIGVVERKPALPTALVALGLSFGTHYVFWTLLRVPLPAGPFGI